ncbi:MAG: hypothetical protein A2W01_09160 [Candidatus Solincola sediminis]|uniref:Bacterial bifunctional deaminase-reductase C-terminal domain-containing protein n=1 Tax=Candidatus Solincola sediminis TaxID=1797199 RepID=A0A1F2WH61_9ACTN|nr:MAG: hypothetical protein A2Y75_03450 [Candidatus Solincola sediminis]OFW60411.1 MAG: hypothetical protein A2W01_09160 [Candidatus Solincola sediminis]
MLPRVILHNQASLDGRLDWLQADLGLFYGIVSLFEEDATLTGCDTIFAAYGEQECVEDIEDKEREANDKLPLLVVTDSKGRLSNWQRLRREEYWRDVVALCSNSTPPAFLDHLSDIHVDAIVTGNGQVDLRRALWELNSRYGVEVVRVDSGGALNGALLRAGLVDEVSLLISPTVVGGLSPRSLFRAPDLETVDGLLHLELQRMEQLDGGVVWLHYYAVK